MIIIAVVVSVVGPTLGGFICFGTRKMKQKGKHTINHGHQSRIYATSKKEVSIYELCKILEANLLIQRTMQLHTYIRKGKKDRDVL